MTMSDVTKNGIGSALIVGRNKMLSEESLRNGGMS